MRSFAIHVLCHVARCAATAGALALAAPALVGAQYETDPFDPREIQREPLGVRPVEKPPTLTEAAAAGDAGMVGALIGAGADLDERDAAGRTALHLASRAGFAPIVVELIRAGAGVDARNSAGITPLIAAAANGQIDAARILLANCADVDVRDIRGRTALHFASARGYTDLAWLLIRNGADVKARQGAGGTPFRTAVSFRQREIMALLRENGAQTYVPSAEELDAKRNDELPLEGDTSGSDPDAGTSSPESAPDDLPGVSATTPRPRAPSIRERVRDTSPPRGTEGTMRYVQQKLTELGYDPGPVDGRMGDKTQTSVAAFASETGVYGATTGEITRCLVKRLTVEAALVRIDAERREARGDDGESLYRSRSGDRSRARDASVD